MALKLRNRDSIKLEDARKSLDDIYKSENLDRLQKKIYIYTVVHSENNKFVNQFRIFRFTPLVDSS